MAKTATARAMLVGCAVLAIGGAGRAYGQGLVTGQSPGSPETYFTVLIPPVPADDDRGHNLSVLEMPHPDYDPIGTRLGSFIVNPSVTMGVEASSNVFANDLYRKSDVTGVLLPYVSVRSDWTRDQFVFEAGGDLRHHVAQPLVNHDSWYVNAASTLEVNNDIKLRVESQAGHFFESPFSSDANAQSEVLSSYYRYYSAARATVTANRVRIVANADFADYNFDPIKNISGVTSTQNYRNRQIKRGTVRAEYAVSPSVNLYVQGGGDFTNYQIGFGGFLPRQNSHGLNILAGANFDVAGFLRGSVGAGYTSRHYTSSYYRSASGLSLQAKVELFPTDLTTVTAIAQRLIEDASLGGTAYVDTRASIGVDHSVRENLIVSANGAYVVQQFFGLASHRHLLQIDSYAQFQATRSLGFRAEVRYTGSSVSGPNIGNPFKEAAAAVSATLRH